MMWADPRGADWNEITYLHYYQRTIANTHKVLSRLITGWQHRLVSDLAHSCCITQIGPVMIV